MVLNYDGGWNWVERPGKVLDIIALGGVQVPPLEYPSAGLDSLFLDPCGLIQKLN